MTIKRAIETIPGFQIARNTEVKDNVNVFIRFLPESTGDESEEEQLEKIEKFFVKVSFDILQAIHDDKRPEAPRLDISKVMFISKDGKYYYSWRLLYPKDSSKEVEKLVAKVMEDNVDMYNTKIMGKKRPAKPVNLGPIGNILDRKGNHGRGAHRDN